MKHKGFTLVELLIVIAILGILIAVGLSSFTSSQKKSRDLRRKSDLRQIALALETYYTDFGRFPLADGSTHQIKGCGDGAIAVCAWGAIWNNSDATKQTVYMSTLPADPVETYSYYYDSDGTYYKLYAYIENSQDEGVGVKQSGYSGVFCTTDTLCTYAIASTGTNLDN